MTIEPDRCFVLHSRDGTGRFPMYRTTEGKVAVLLFKTGKSAQRFVEGKHKTAEWSISELSGPAAIDWLRSAIKDNGASEIAVDPDPAASPESTSVIPIFPVLVEWEGQRHE